jgi:hypothetical protein
MSSDIDAGAAFGRAKDVLLKPKETLESMRGESQSMQSIITYTAIVAIPTLIGLIIGFGVVGVGGFGYRIRVSFGYALTSGIVQYVFAIVGVIILGYIINALAPSFSSDKDLIQAMKVAAYGSTPGLIAGILYILPALSPLVLLAGLYGLYIMYLGLPSLLGTPEDKKVTYFVVILVVYIIISAVVGQIGGLII